MARRPKHPDEMQKVRPYSGGTGLLVFAGVMFGAVFLHLAHRHGFIAYALHYLTAWTQ